MTSALLPCAIIVARCSSQRLPGKVLRQVHDRPMLRYVVEKVSRCACIGSICVATSDDPSDDPVADYCQENNLACVRGDLNDVAARVLKAAEVMDADCFFRVNGDSPLLGMELLERAWGVFQSAQPDLVTNIHPRTFPPGASVELISRAAMRRAVAAMSDPADREHVTRYFYQHADHFRIENLLSDRDYAGVHLAVDSPADFTLLESVVKRMDRPHWEYSLSQTVDLYLEAAAHG